MLPLHGSQSVSLSLPHSLSVSWLLSCEISYIVISNGVRGRLTSPRLASSRRRPRTHAINLRNTGWQHFLFSLFAFAIYPRFEFNFQVTPKRGHNGCPPVCVFVCVGLFVLAQARMFWLWLRVYCWCWGCCRLPVLCASIRSQVASEA